MLKIYQACHATDFEKVESLTREYLLWTQAQMKEHFDEALDIEAMLEYSLSERQAYLPPDGQLLLAEFDSTLAGIVFLKRISDKTCEIKRMFVRPGFRGKRIGYHLLESLIAGARHSGYTEILLDSTKFMSQAHRLYRSVGFQETARYPQSEIGESFQQHMVYMSLKL